MSDTNGELRNEVERQERAEIAVKIRRKTDLSLREIAEIVDRSQTWMAHQIRSTETGGERGEEE